MCDCIRSYADGDFVKQVKLTLLGALLLQLLLHQALTQSTTDLCRDERTFEAALSSNAAGSTTILQPGIAVSSRSSFVVNAACAKPRRPITRTCLMQSANTEPDQETH